MRGLAQSRLAALERQGIVATPALATVDIAWLDRKRLAVSHYPSQLRAFGPNGYDDVFAPERAWTL